MICIKKKIKTRNGMFKIGSIVLNEVETWNDDNVKPICAKNDYIITFLPNGSKGVHVGKKHFNSVDDAEAYIWLLDIKGFSLVDL